MFADKEGQLKVFLEDGSELTLSGLPPPLKANNYDVPSTVPPDDPIKRVAGPPCRVHALCAGLWVSQTQPWCVVLSPTPGAWI